MAIIFCSFLSDISFTFFVFFLNLSENPSRPVHSQHKLELLAVFLCIPELC